MQSKALGITKRKLKSNPASVPHGLSQLLQGATAKKETEVTISAESGFMNDSEVSLVETASEDEASQTKISIATSYAPKQMANNILSKVTGQPPEKLDIMSLVMMLNRDPKAVLAKMMKLPIKEFFTTGLSYKQLHLTVSVLTLALSTQLYYSKRTRSMLKRTFHTLAFGCTFFGLIITLTILYVKYKILNKSKVTESISA